MINRILLIVFPLIFILACQQKKYGPFTVSGKVLNAAGTRILLEEIPFGGDQPIVIDSGTVGKTGNFELRGFGKEESLYRLTDGSSFAILLVNDAKSIRIQVNANEPNQYTLEGSESSNSLRKLLKTYNEKDSLLYQRFLALDNLQKTPGNDSLILIEKNLRNRQLKEMNDFVSNFINESGSPAARYYALGMASRTMQPEALLALANTSAEKFKEHSGLAKIKSLLTVQSVSKEPGHALLNTIAPEINLPDTEGKLFSLSSLKGKYVLVDFWASWCAPCRAENPNVVNVYNKFKDKNFTILGVSLDEDKASWLKAIRDDQLNWKQISDLKYWNSSVVSLYQIEGIPFNVLVDPTGKIIAANLRGSALNAQLASIFP